MKLLLGILEREKPESAIIFCNTKRYAEIAAKRLRINGYHCEFIMGDLPQVKRLRIINDIKSGAIKYLVATDVAARGLDIEGLGMVVNFDLPAETENYVHRIGRTARAGKTGKAVTLASEQDVYELPAIERYIGKKIPAETAVAELYAVDKSEGMHIHTDFYEERDNSRSRKGPAREGRTENKDRKTGGRTGAGRRERDRRRSGDTVPQRSAPRTERGFPEDKGKTRDKRDGSGPYHPRRIPAGAAEPDISHLSFDERMAYYKRKYEGSSRNNPAGNASGAPAKDSETKAADENRQSRERSRRRRRRRGRRREAAGEMAVPEREETTDSRQERQGGKSYETSAGEQPPATRTSAARQTPKNARPEVQPPAAQEVQTESKKGFFSRLAGLFKKPKGSAPDSPSTKDT
jgi:ATP-dependent RNA helicase RhlB